MTNKKELKAQYLQMKKEMGVYSIKSLSEKKYYIEGTNDLKGTMNGTVFKLKFGGHSNKELQKCWNEQGEEGFAIEVLELLPHAEDESKTDYTEELDILTYIWTEKYEQEGYAAFKKALVNKFGKQSK